MKTKAKTKESFTPFDTESSGEFLQDPMGGNLNLLPPSTLIRDLEEIHGISRKTLRKYESEGVNLFDKAAVAERANRDTSPEIKELRRQKIEAETKLKIAQAERAEIELAKTKGELVPLADVCETNTTIGAKVKAQIKSLSVTLPSACEGLPAAEIAKRIEAAGENILEFLWGELSLDGD